MADHREQTFLGAATMNIAIPGAHGPERGAEISAHGVQNVFAKSKAAGRVPDEGRKNVAFVEEHADGNAQSLLSLPQEHAADNFSGSIQAGKLLIQVAGEKHPPVGIQIPVFERRAIGGQCLADLCLNHGSILSFCPTVAQSFL
jgi:hypothetical protein